MGASPGHPTPGAGNFPGGAAGTNSGGGGGGGLYAGKDATSYGGDGRISISSAISGTSTVYGVGGGGGGPANNNNCSESQRGFGGHNGDGAYGGYCSATSGDDGYGDGGGGGDGDGGGGECGGSSPGSR